MKSKRLRNLLWDAAGRQVWPRLGVRDRRGAEGARLRVVSSTGKEIKLADFAGKKPVVLFFYVGAFTDT